MNKQELIKHIEDLPYKEGHIVDKIDISRKGLLELVNQLDEPEKVKVPQFVADYIEYAKKEDYHILGAMSEVKKHENKDIEDWFYTDDNIEIFARAWLDGYEVENRYRVKMKGIVNALSFLSYHKKADIWSVTDINNSNDHRTHHTKKELEESGFCEVFNSPLFEVEEVER